MSDSQRLPDRPDLRHLRDQARDLLRSGAAPTLAQAQLCIARSYGFASWPKLKAHVEALQEHGRLKEAIDREEPDTVREMMTLRPELHRAPLGYHRNGPLTWVAECRAPRRAPTAVRLEMARWMIENGSDVHQGGDGPLMRAELSDERIPMMELLVRHGADVNARAGTSAIRSSARRARPFPPAPSVGYWSAARTPTPARPWTPTRSAVTRRSSTPSCPWAGTTAARRGFC